MLLYLYSCVVAGPQKDKKITQLLCFVFLFFFTVSLPVQTNMPRLMLWWCLCTEKYKIIVFLYFLCCFDTAYYTKQKF